MVVIQIVLQAFVVLNLLPDPVAAIRDILFERVHTDAIRYADIQSVGDTWLEDIKFWGVRVQAGDQPAERPDWERPSLFHLKRVRGAEFRFLHMTWPANRDQCWDKVLRTYEVEGLEASEDEITEATATE